MKGHTVLVDEQTPDNQAQDLAARNRSSETPCSL
jgi:hypothetical protein